MEIFNKQYKRKGSVGGDIFIPIDTETSGDTVWIIFNNGARCKEETFNNDFELINSNVLVNENNNQDSDYIDPDKFFAPAAPESLLNDIETAINNPQSLGKPKYDLSEPQPPAHMLAAMESKQPANHLLARLDDEPINNYENQPQFNQNFNRVKEVRLPEWDVFDRVKKSDQVQIHIPFNIKLPKATKIDTMDDMFETSFIEYLAKQYIDTVLLQNTELLKEILTNAISEWVDNEMSNKRKKSKIESEVFEIKTESKAKDKAKINEEPEIVEEPEETNQESDNIDEKD